MRCPRRPKHAGRQAGLAHSDDGNGRRRLWALDAIKNDLEQIADAQGDLNDERKQEVESANQQFSAQLEAVAGDLGSNLSLSGAKAQVESAGKELASSYQQTFASIDCA